MVREPFLAHRFGAISSQTTTKGVEKPLIFLGLSTWHEVCLCCAAQIPFLQPYQSSGETQ
jgi:hypothetical protein